MSFNLVWFDLPKQFGKGYKLIWHLILNRETQVNYLINNVTILFLYYYIFMGNGPKCESTRSFFILFYININYVIVFSSIYQFKHPVVWEQWVRPQIFTYNMNLY